MGRGWEGKKNEGRGAWCGRREARAMKQLNAQKDEQTSISPIYRFELTEWCTNYFGSIYVLILKCSRTCEQTANYTELCARADFLPTVSRWRSEAFDPSNVYSF